MWREVRESFTILDRDESYERERRFFFLVLFIERFGSNDFLVVGSIRGFDF